MLREQWDEAEQHMHDNWRRVALAQNSRTGHWAVPRTGMDAIQDGLVASDNRGCVAGAVEISTVKGWQARTHGMT